MKLNKKRWINWHKKLAYIVGIPMLMWALSGILHPVMANFMRPEIARRFLPPVPLNVETEIKKPADVLAELGEVHQLKLADIDQELHYLAVTTDEEHHYFNANTGEKSSTAETAYAEQLARAYLADDKSELVSVTKITEFGDSYGYINRLLPVFRVKLDRADGIEVVVDPRTRRLATVDSPAGRLCGKMFNWFHRWSFLGDRFSPVRITVVSLLSLLGVLAGISGVVSLFALKSKNSQGKKRKMSRSRRWHRRLGWVTVVFYFMFSMSGFYHVVYKFTGDDSTSWQSAQTVDVSKLGTSLSDAKNLALAPISEVSLAVINEVPYYRLAVAARGAQPVYVNTITGELTKMTDRGFAKHLALEFSGYEEADIKEVEPIFTFRQDYGFIFKRLPVWRVSFNNKEYWQYTVDTADAHMAMRMKPGSLVETLSFINLHKLHFLDGLGKSARDWVGSFAALSIALLCFFGLLLLVKNKASKVE